MIKEGWWEFQQVKILWQEHKLRMLQASLMNDAREEVNLGNHKKETERNQTFNDSYNKKLE